jgi:patatin-like phospholipase/acyl hydrolase
MYRILSLDGGGLRGVLTAKLLERLETAVPGFLDSVDLFAGTSTGGILVLGLASGMSPTEIADMYKDCAAHVFADSAWDNLRDLGKLTGADYSNDYLKQAILDCIGDVALGDLPRRVLVSSFELDNQGRTRGMPRTWKAKFFHNYPGPESDSHEKVVDVALRTSAAPTYFPMYQGFVDGGVVVNNPSMCALAQALHPRTGGQRVGDVALLSLGTGCTSKFLTAQDADWGLAQWAPHLVSMMIEGGVAVSDYQCRQVLDERYMRVNPILPGPIGLDDVNQIPLLEEIGEIENLLPAVHWLRSYFAVD